jgi:sarcosine oxidase subunit beta
MANDYDVIIIGAGVIGVCVGFELAKRGRKTLNVDKLPAAGYGSTSNTCAIIRLHYSTPDGVAMARESYFYWLDWGRYLGVADEAGLARYVNTGCLVSKNDRNKDLVNVMRSLDELHVVYENLDADGMERRFPWLDTQSYGPPVTMDDERFGKPTGEKVRGAVYIPESGYIDDPQLACHNVQRACEAHGGGFKFNAEVADILKHDGRVDGVKLADGTVLRAPVVVNVGGPHSFIINRMAGVEEGMNIKTRALKQEVCHVPAPEGVNYNQLAPIISDGDIGCYSRPETGNHVLIGSEDPPCDALEWVDDPDDYNQNFTHQWKTQVIREAQRVKGLGVPNQTQGLVDLYDVADDWIPIYDKSDLPGFYMAVGTSGNQFKNAPVAGKLMAELIERVEAGRDHDDDPVTLHLPYTRRVCNVGFFSRLRTLNPDSSYSVIG